VTPKPAESNLAMFAVLYLPRFWLQAALRHEPELWAKPVALVDPARSTPVVCDGTEPALAAGVAKGLTPTQAMARCGHVLIRHRSRAHEATAAEIILQCAYAFSPHLEATAEGLCTLDLRGLAALAGAGHASLAHWAGRLRGALADQNLRARIGVGPTPNVARHAARWTEGIEIVGAPKTFLAALPVEALEPSTDVSLILQKWGIRTVGELLALGQEALADRFGLEALGLFAAASTTASRPLNLVRPGERFEESFEFEHEIETIEPLLFILRRFVDQLSRRLEHSGWVAELLTLRLRLESGENVEGRLRLPQPTRHPDVLFRMLHTHLENLRTDSPIRSATLTAGPSQQEQKQFGLFEMVLRDPHQFQETLARLAALLGADRVGTPVLEDTHRPDAFRMAPPDFENAPALSANRRPRALQPAPMRRFRPAIKATAETKAGAATNVSSSSSSPSEERAGRGPRRGETNNNEPPLPGPLLHPMEEREKSGSLMQPGGGAGAKVNGDQSPPPISIHCSVADGKLAVAIGPWRASGNWWEPGTWQREEWDVATLGGKVLRLSKQPDGWFVEGILD
jgi:protein ImuB